MLLTRGTNMMFIFHVITTIFFIGAHSGELRGFINPLNSKSIDLFLVVDERSTYSSILDFGLFKTTLKSMFSDLNPSGSSPYFGAYFFGATSSVQISVPFRTQTADAAKALIDIKQYPFLQSNPSTLSTALALVESDCSLYCRAGVPRVTIIFSGAPQFSNKPAILQLENNRGMTVMFVGIGSNASELLVNELASYPKQYYGVRVQSMHELTILSQHISSIASDVPRLISTNQPISISFTSPNVYYTVQLNLLPYTTQVDKIIMVASNCPQCRVYGSVLQPNPIFENTPEIAIGQPFYTAAGYPNTIFYFRVPKDTARFYLSIRSNGMNDLKLVLDTFQLPTMLTA